MSNLGGNLRPYVSNLRGDLRLYVSSRGDGDLAYVTSYSSSVWKLVCTISSVWVTCEAKVCVSIVLI